MVTFDPTINIGNIVVMTLAILAFISGWYKFGGRLDMLEYKVEAIEKTLTVIASILEKQNMLDRRVVIVEGGLETANKEISALRRGDGWIRNSATVRPGGVNGEYD